MHRLQKTKKKMRMKNIIHPASPRTKPTCHTTAALQKIVFCVLLLWMLLPTGAAAQRDYTADSAAFVNADWHADTLNGFRYLHHHFMHRQVFNSNQCFSVIEIPSGSPSRLCFVADTHLTTVSAFAARHGALAAINGSYFNMRTGVPVCYLRIDGREIGVNTPSRNDSIYRKYYQYATIRLTPTRRPRFLVPDSSRMAERALPDSNIMTAGPMLIRKGMDIPQRMDRHFVYGRHNRTAIGLKPDGTVVLLVVDGRHSREAEGLSLPELTRVMRWLGCCDAVNLDGGGSTTMYIKDRGNEGIVNHPSDNGRFDTAGQRPVANAIILTQTPVKRSSRSK